MLISLVSSLGLLTGCNISPEFTPYYTGKAPSIEGIKGGNTFSFEGGNLGGNTITLQGSGFGEDADTVVVQFGSLNAQIVSVSDTEIELVTPKGPITGGLVDVSVATEGGQATADDLYEYQVGTSFDGQVAFLAVNDYYYSCYGGVDDSYNAGCDAISYVGNAGLAGGLEVYGFEFPRIHSQDYGWFGGTDWSNDWQVQIPAYRPFAQSVDRLRRPLPEDVTLFNPNLVEEAPWCADLNALGSWYYGGTDSTAPVSYSNDDSTLLESLPLSDCENGLSGTRLYDLSMLDFCELEEFETETNTYAPEWPIGMPFFAPFGESKYPEDFEDPAQRANSCFDGIDNDEDDLMDWEDPDCTITVEMQAPQTGLDGLVLNLPEQARFQATEGFGNGDLWSLMPIDSCLENETDPEGETAFTISWEPSSFEPSADDKILGVSTHVRVSLTVLSVNWFGTEAQPARATVTVDDWNNYDEETGLSSVSMPSDILYQFPAIDMGWGGCTENLGQTTCNWGDPARNDYGFVVLTADRVTEYVLHSENKNIGGDLVFSYTSGDLSFLGNEGFDHPFDRGTCGDCEDNDADGWIDSLDADCEFGEDEDGSFDDQYGCSDGQDNDGNGLIDAEDTENCPTGYDGETNCFDGEDNDGDGWVDALDGECADLDSQELGADDAAWTCSDGLDNDGDGWFDDEDPACAAGTDTEDDDFSGTACNDDIDNDGHGDIDAEDPLCQEEGASFDSEEPEFSDQCLDGEDNDADGYIDGFDPDCERPNFWRENTTSDSEGPACYDGVDNDDDGYIDAEDPGCWNVNEDFGFVAEPDGFLDSEGADGNCTDGVDNDGDGAIDLDDPGCSPGVGKVEGLAD